MLRFANLKISHKIMAMLAMFAVVSICATVFATNRMRFIDDSYGDLIDGPGRANLAIARANRNLVYASRSLYRLLTEVTAEGAQQAAQEIADTQGFFDRQITIAIKGMPAVAGDIRHISGAFRSAMAGPCAEVIRLGVGPGPTDRQRALDRMHAACDPALNGLMDDISALTNKIIKLNDGASEAALAVTNATIRNTYWLQLGGLAVTLLLATLISRFTISQPIRKVTSALERLAKGELDGKIDFVDRRDEIGGIARTALVFLEVTRSNRVAQEALARETEAAEARQQAALRQAADMIEQQSKLITASTSESSAALNDCAQRLFESAGRNAVSVRTVNEASEEALQSSEAVAAYGDKLSSSALHIANQIASTVSEIAGASQAGHQAREIIGQLAAAVGEIEAVAQLIGEIAGRTNLLALNATIEAARAGEAGRGFAVVANEVKALATQTARSTSEIAQNIGAIRRVTDAAVSSVGEVVARMGTIEQTTQTIAGAAQQQNEATSEIARNVTAAASAMRSVSEQIACVSAEMRGTDAAIGEMRAAAATVSDRIAELSHVMVRIVRTSSDAANRRNAERKRLQIDGVLVDGGLTVPVVCVDLSASGARLELSVANQRLPPVGHDIVLRLPRLPDLTGKIVRISDDVGIQFDWHPAEAPPALRAILDHAMAA